MTRLIRNRIDGVADPLPEGERILWSGKPDAWKFTRRIMRLQWVLAWFLVLAVYRAYGVGSHGGDFVSMLSAATGQLPLALFALGLLSCLGIAMARSTSYVISPRRLVFQVGVALPITFNVPVRFIDGATLRMHQKHAGDVILSLRKGSKVKALALWPHCQGWTGDSVQAVMRDLSTESIEEMKPVLAKVLEDSQKEEEQSSSYSSSVSIQSQAVHGFTALESMPA